MAFKSVWGFNPEELLRAHSMSFLLGNNRHSGLVKVDSIFDPCRPFFSS